MSQQSNESNESNESSKGFFLITLFTTTIGVVFTMVMNFGVMRVGYNPDNILTNVVHFDLNNPLAPTTFLVVALGFLYGAYVSLLGLLGKPNSKRVSRGFLVQILTFIIILTGGIIFFLATIQAESYMQSWSFDLGFYVPFLMSIVSVILLYKTKLVHFDNPL